MQQTRSWFANFLAVLCIHGVAAATDIPTSSYIFPAGGQRGTSVPVRIGAHYLHGGAPLRVIGQGVTASDQIKQIERIWFEGPLIVKPASQQGEDYPKDHSAEFTIANDAPLGKCFWQVWTSQGAVESRPFVIGDLPEMVESEIDGAPVPTSVELPITINGRIFPREDVDIWCFHAVAGQTITCEVNAARIGSPLDSRIEVRGPDGQRIAENDDHFNADSMVRIRAKADGKHEIRIHDISFGGLQNYVYRLTVRAGSHVDHLYPLGASHGTIARFYLFGEQLSGKEVSLQMSDAVGPQLRQIGLGVEQVPSNPIAIMVGDCPEVVEPIDEETEGSEPKKRIELTQPKVINGRIATPGDIDRWPISATAGTKVLLDLKSSSLGSRLDAKIVVRGEDDHVLLDAGSTPAKFEEPTGTFTMPASGRCEIDVRHFDAHQGGDNFAYRLKLWPNPIPDFSLTLPSDAFTLYRGDSAKIKIGVKRIAGFDHAIQLSAENLPEGVTAKDSTIAANKNEGELTLVATADVRIGATVVQVNGRESIPADKGAVDSTTKSLQDSPLVRTARLLRRAGEPVRDELLLAVAIKTPFKIVGDRYRSEYAHRGAVHHRPYLVDRGGYEGPLTITLADKQARHLQGVIGRKVIVPTGKSTFLFPIQLPTWLEQNRTGRMVVMGVGEVTDEDGRKHKVSYSSSNVNDQIIVLTSPSLTGVEISPSHIPLVPNTTVRLDVSVKRGQLFAKQVTVELVAPKHIRGITAQPVTIEADKESGRLEVNVAAPEGPFNMPLIIRATTRDENDDPVVAECSLDLVP